MCCAFGTPAESPNRSRPENEIGPTGRVPGVEVAQKLFLGGLSNRRSLRYGLLVISAGRRRPAPRPAGGPGQRGMKSPETPTTINSLGDRLLTPDDTIARVMAHEGAFGITRVANLTGLDRTGIPVVMVCRPNARSSAVFNGKGVDIAAAKASGAHGSRRDVARGKCAPPLQFASFADLRARLNLVDVDGLPRTPGAAVRSQPADPVGRGAQSHGRRRGLAAVRNRARGFPRLRAADERLAFDEHQWSGVRQRPSGGGQPRALRSYRTRRDKLVASKPAARTGRQTPRPGDGRRSEVSRDPRSSRRTPSSMSRSGTSRPTSARRRSNATSSTARARSVISASAPPVIRAREIALLRAILEAAQVRTTYIIGSREDIEPADYDPATLRARNAEARALMRQSAGLARFPLGRERASSRPPKPKSIGFSTGCGRSGSAQAVAVDLTRPEIRHPGRSHGRPGPRRARIIIAANYAPGARARAVRARDR